MCDNILLGAGPYGYMYWCSTCESESGGMTGLDYCSICVECYYCVGVGFRWYDFCSVCGGSNLTFSAMYGDRCYDCDSSVELERSYLPCGYCG